MTAPSQRDRLPLGVTTYNPLQPPTLAADRDLEFWRTGKAEGDLELVNLTRCPPAIPQVALGYGEPRTPSTPDTDGGGDGDQSGTVSGKQHPHAHACICGFAAPQNLQCRQHRQEELSAGPDRFVEVAKRSVGVAVDQLVGSDPFSVSQCQAS